MIHADDFMLRYLAPVFWFAQLVVPRHTPAQFGLRSAGAILGEPRPAACSGRGVNRFGRPRRLTARWRQQVLSNQATYTCWRRGFDWREETKPELIVTLRRLDSQTPNVACRPGWARCCYH